MIEHILECLKLEMKSDSEYIAIAKGNNKLPMTIKEALQPLKNILCLKK